MKRIEIQAPFFFDKTSADCSIGPHDEQNKTLSELRLGGDHYFFNMRQSADLFKMFNMHDIRCDI